MLTMFAAHMFQPANVHTNKLTPRVVTRPEGSMFYMDVPPETRRAREWRAVRSAVLLRMKSMFAL